LADYKTDITDFEVERAKDGANMVLKLGLKFYEARHAGPIIERVGHLDGVKHVMWEVE